MYKYSASDDRSLSGYVNFSLSIFAVEDFEERSVPNDNKYDVFGDVTHCRCVLHWEFVIYVLNRACSLIFRLNFVKIELCLFIDTLLIVIPQTTPTSILLHWSTGM